MSLEKIRPFFRERLSDLGFLEHEDVFNRENIPKTIIDKSFHILIDSISGGSINHTHQDITAGVTISLYFKGFRDVGQTLDASILDVERIIKQVCNVKARTSELLNVVFNSADFSAINIENDNSIIAEMSFDAQIVMCVDEI